MIVVTGRHQPMWAVEAPLISVCSFVLRLLADRIALCFSTGYCETIVLYSTVNTVGLFPKRPRVDLQFVSQIPLLFCKRQNNSTSKLTVMEVEKGDGNAGLRNWFLFVFPTPWCCLNYFWTRHWCNLLFCCHPVWVAVHLSATQQEKRSAVCLDFITITMSRTHTFTFSDCMEIWCFYITDNEPNHYNLGPLRRMCGWSVQQVSWSFHVWDERKLVKCYTLKDVILICVLACNDQHNTMPLRHKKILVWKAVIT